VFRRFVVFQSSLSGLPAALFEGERSLNASEVGAVLAGLSSSVVILFVYGSQNVLST
jgi:hypothetical protein